MPPGLKINMDTVTVPALYLTKGVHVLTFNIYGKIYVDKFMFREVKSSGITAPPQLPITVYPNPSNRIFNVKLWQAGFLSVSDINGHKIYSKYVNCSSVIDMSGYSAGIYILSFISDNQIYKTKLIKTA